MKRLTRKEIDEWIEKGEEIAKKNDYSNKEIRLYKRVLEAIKKDFEPKDIDNTIDYHCPKCATPILMVDNSSGTIYQKKDSKIGLLDNRIYCLHCN